MTFKLEVSFTEVKAVFKLHTFLFGNVKTIEIIENRSQIGKTSIVHPYKTEHITKTTLAQLAIPKV